MTHSTKKSVLAATALFAVPLCVLAQDSDEPTGATSVLMEEITVTARRRPESLTDLPMSVSAYSADSLEIRGIRRIDKIDRISPNIKFQNNPSFGGSSNSAARDDRAALGLAGVAVQSGAQSALASLWYISDAATAELIENFYGALQLPQNGKAESLRLAQLELLKTERFNHPSFWAPYLLVGNWL